MTINESPPIIDDQPDMCMNTTLRTLRYHYLFKLYLPMYRLIYAKQQWKTDKYQNQVRIVKMEYRNRNDKGLGMKMLPRKVILKQCKGKKGAMVDNIRDGHNNKVVHFAPHPTVLHLQSLDNQIYNNSAYLRAQHPLDNINLNEDSDSDEEDVDCWHICKNPQCTHICQSPQCIHAQKSKNKLRRSRHRCHPKRFGGVRDKQNNNTWTNKPPQTFSPHLTQNFAKRDLRGHHCILAQKSHHEYVVFQSRRTDREEIRRKLAMGGDEDYYGGERAFKKPNLQTRLQSGMNLQICFMNDTAVADGDVNSAATVATISPGVTPGGSKENQEVGGIFILCHFL